MKLFARTICTGMLFIAAASQSYASSGCFSSKAEYDSVKSNLPNSLQTLPAVFTVNEFMTRAGVIIESPKSNPNKLKLQMRVLSPMTITKDMYIQKACFSGQQLKVTLEDKSEHLVQMNRSSLTVMNTVLAKTDQKTFDKLLSPAKAGGSIFGLKGQTGSK